MSDQLTFKGKLKIQPPLSLVDTSGLTTTEADISESMLVNNKLDTVYILAADSAEPVNFGDLAGAHVVMLKATANVTVTVTSAAGVAQVFPCNGFLLLEATTVPITAMTLTRDAGIATTVRVILVEQGS